MAKVSMKTDLGASADKVWKMIDVITEIYQTGLDNLKKMYGG